MCSSDLKNGVQITNQEMNRLVQQEVSRFPEQAREVQKYFSENAMAAAQLRAPLFEEKVVDFLLGKAAVTDRTVSRSDLEAAIESDDETPTGHVHGPDCGHEPAAKPAKKAAAKKAAPAASEAAAEAVAEKPVKKVAAKKAAADEAAPVVDEAAPVVAKKAPAKKKAAE